MIRLRNRASTAGASMLAVVVMLALSELVFRERSALDLAIFGLLGAIAAGTYVLLRMLTRTLTASLVEHHELQMRLGQQHAVAALGQLALTDVTEQELLDEACRSVAAELDVDLAGILELLPDKSGFVLRAASGWPPEQVGVQHVPAGPKSHAGYTIRMSAPVVMSDAATETRFELSPHMAMQKVTSGLSTTIGLNGSTYGVLGAHTYEPRHFSDEDVTFLDAVATMLAGALGRRAAVEETDRAYRVLEAVIEGTTDHVFVLDADGRYIVVNEPSARAFGRPRDELIGCTVTELLPGPTGEALAATDRLVLEHDQVETFEVPLTIGDTDYVMLTTKGPYRARDGTVLGLFGIARDITQRKNAEQELARSEERFRLAQDGTQMGTWDVDLTSGESTWSDGLRRLFGVGPEYPAGLESLAPLVHPEDRARVLARLRESYASGNGFEFENRIVRPDGGLRWLLCRANPLRDATGAAVRILGVAVDFTERKVAEEELLRSEETLRLAESAAQLGIWDWNVETRKLAWTPALYEILGLDPESDDPSFETIAEFIHPDDRDGLFAEVRHVLESGQMYFEHPCRVVQPSGEVRSILNRGTITRDEHGRPKHIVGVTLDETERKNANAERKRLEDRLRQAETLEAVGRLAGGVAHDFNNLLLGIRGYSELAVSRLARGDIDVKDDVEAVIRAADRAADLTKQLLAFGRRQVLTPEVLDLNSVVRETSGLLRRVIGEHVELVTNLADRPVVTKADRGQLEQVITNLALNGRHAMPNGGVLAISVGIAELENGLGETVPHALLTVTDEGTGIDDATAPHIFEPFFTTKGDEGTGLGLATVHGIVTQSGGRIVVDSELEHGSTFRVYLPLSSEELAPVAAPKPAPAAGGTETILLVEDDDTVRSIVGMMLVEHGYSIIEASSGAEAISLFEARTQPIQLVLSDLVMRGLDGRETIDGIRAIEPDTKVLYMSGYTDDEIIRSGRLGSGTGFIQKPFSGDELAACLHEVLTV